MSKYLIFLHAFFLLIFIETEIGAQNAGSKIISVANNVIENTSFKIINTSTGEMYESAAGLPLAESFRMESAYNDWHYWNGVLALGMIELGKVTGDEKYAAYARKNFSFIFENLAYFEKQYEQKFRKTSLNLFFRMSKLDDCGAMAAALCEVYQLSKKPEYLEYLKKAAQFIAEKELRLPDRTIVRNRPRKFTLWADDLYMSVPFLARMAVITGDTKYFDDAILLVKNFNKYLYNPANGLVYHCWYSDNHQNGVAHWGRCNGWVMMAQVELIDLLPENHPERKNLIELLENQITGIARFQDYSGLWHQLIDKPDSYLESSASAMFVYGVAKAVNRGWISNTYAQIAVNGWNGLEQKIQPDGQVQDICIGTGIEDNIRFYYNRPTLLNDIHGLGAVLLAGTEMIKLKKLLADLEKERARQKNLRLKEAAGSNQ